MSQNQNRPCGRRTRDGVERPAAGADATDAFLARLSTMNFCFVVPDVLAGCARPYVGGDDDDLAALLRQGIAGIVSLTETPLAASRLAESKLAYAHIPVRDFCAPSMHDVRSFVEFVRRVTAERGGPVVAHCGSGYGRTGTMLACYLVAEGRSPDEAIAAVRALRPGSIETRAQEQAVRAWATHLRGGGTCAAPEVDDGPSCC
jgi:atypical dual specificity phosphatase